VLILVVGGDGRVKLNKKSKESLSKYCMYGAVASVLLALVGYLGIDIWLASTQWLLVASVLALFGVYLKLS
jgi:hypothetical protein